MANEGYHEPIDELSDETRDMHKAIVSLILEKSVGHGFCVQISSQNREAIVSHQTGDS